MGPSWLKGQRASTQVSRVEAKPDQEAGPGEQRVYKEQGNSHVGEADLADSIISYNSL